MSAVKPLPLPRNELISNVEIMEMTGFNINRVNLLKAKPLFPPALCFFPCRTALYRKAAVIIWFERFPQRTFKPRSGKTPTKPKKIKPRNYEFFDNLMAVKFLSNQIGTRVKRKFPGTGKTTVINLIDRNDYEVLRKL